MAEPDTAGGTRPTCGSERDRAASTSRTCTGTGCLAYQTAGTDGRELYSHGRDRRHYDAELVLETACRIRTTGARSRGYTARRTRAAETRTERTLRVGQRRRTTCHH